MSGLGQMLTGGQEPVQEQQARPMRDLNQIVAMIKQGVNPEELVQGGVPVELVQEAMMIIQEEVTSVPPEQAGLAGMMTR